MSVPQLPLALRYPPDQRLESFIAAPPGAIAQLRALAEAAGADWLYLAGAAGTGKTHLALALCAVAEQAGRRSAYLPLAAASGWPSGPTGAPSIAGFMLFLASGPA